MVTDAAHFGGRCGVSVSDSQIDVIQLSLSDGIVHRKGTAPKYAAKLCVRCFSHMADTSKAPWNRATNTVQWRIALDVVAVVRTREGIAVVDQQ